MNNNENGATTTIIADGTVHVVTDDTFIPEVLEGNVPVLVDFWATWCGPCKMMAPIFAEVAPEYEGKVMFAKLDVDENPQVSSALQIQSIPTFMLISGRTVYAQGAGAMRANDLRKWLDQGLSYIQEHSAMQATGAPASGGE